MPIALFLTVGSATLSARDYDLVCEVDSDSTLAVKTQLQYSGSVIVDSAGEEENARVLPLDVRARLEFDQRISASSATAPQAIRYFEQARAVIKAGKGQTETKLGEAKRLILARMKQESNGSHKVQIASIADTLSQQEYELLKNPGDPLALIPMFQKKNVSIGDKWKLEKDALADLLAINRVITSSVTMLLKSVDDNQAKVYIYGKAKGEVDDAISELQVKAIAILDLDQHLVTSLRMTIDEERRAGQFAPGFEGRIKLESRLEPTTENVMLSRGRLASMNKGRKVKFAFELDRDINEFTLIHDTDWRVIATEEDAVVMRYVHDGQLVAQCNLVQLPNRPVDNPLTLSKFQEEINKITAESEARVTGSNKFATDSGLDVLHVAVDGVESGIPFSWLYYHVAADDGRRVTFVFTHEKEVADYFGSADRTLINSITFKPAKKAPSTARTKDDAATR